MWRPEKCNDCWTDTVRKETSELAEKITIDVPQEHEGAWKLVGKTCYRENVLQGNPKLDKWMSRCLLISFQPRLRSLTHLSLVYAFATSLFGSFFRSINKR